VVDRTAELAEEAAAQANRGKAVRLCLLPALVAGVIVGAVLVAVGVGVYIGAAAFVVVALAVMAALWQSGSSSVIRALGAVPSEESERPRLHNLVDGLCATMGLPRPAVCVVHSQVRNAMAVGRDPASATLIVTTGLDEHLTLVELEGVLAHELVHIKRLDTVLAGTALAVMTPLSLVIGLDRATDRLHGLVGQGREFSADQRAASVVRYPPGLGSALEAMADDDQGPVTWPPGTGRRAALTKWLWIDPMVGAAPGLSMEGNLDDTRVRAQAQSLR
jgi:Zn-dependent protease with chaperone function